MLSVHPWHLVVHVPDVLFQGLEIDSVKLCLPENVIKQSHYCISSIALIPVTTVANHNSQFGTALSLVDVIVRTVANVFTVLVFDSEPAASSRGKM
jgi:hypothetical protein